MFFVLLFLGRIIPYIACTPLACNSGDRNAALLLAVICTGIRLAGPWLLFADTSTSYRLSLSLEIRNTFPSYLQIYSSCNTRKSSSYRAMSWRHQSSGGCTTPVFSVSGLQSCKVPINLSTRRMNKLSWECHTRNPS